PRLPGTERHSVGENSGPMVRVQSARRLLAPDSLLSWRTRMGKAHRGTRSERRASSDRMFQVIVLGGIGLTAAACSSDVSSTSEGPSPTTVSGTGGFPQEGFGPTTVSGTGGFPQEGPASSGAGNTTTVTGTGGFPQEGAGGSSGIGGMGGAPAT